MIENICILAAIGCIFWRHRRQRDEERAARRHYDFVCEVRALGEKR